LARRYPDVHRPAISTIHAVLNRRGLVKHRNGRKNKAVGTVLTNSEQPNDLWFADYKGEFMLTDRRYCYPLTITDYASRYLFAVEALQSTKEVTAFTVFERVFRENGRHERMHLTLKLETTKPAGANFLQQQAKFDHFIAEFNTERPHQALGMKPPPADASASASARST
jgi:putative transposase